MWTSLGKSCSDGDVFAAASTSKKKNICDIEETCKTEITPVQRVKRLILLLCAGWGDWRGTDMLSNQAAYNADVQAGQRVNVLCLPWPGSLSSPLIRSMLQGIRRVAKREGLREDENSRWLEYPMDVHGQHDARTLRRASCWGNNSIHCQ